MLRDGQYCFPKIRLFRKHAECSKSLLGHSEVFNSIRAKQCRFTIIGCQSRIFQITSFNPASSAAPEIPLCRKVLELNLGCCDFCIGSHTLLPLIQSLKKNNVRLQRIHICIKPYFVISQLVRTCTWNRKIGIYYLPLVQYIHSYQRIL